MGEMYAVDENGKPLSYVKGSKILKNPDKGYDNQIRIAVFDIISLNGTDETSRTMDQKIAEINQIFAGKEFVHPVKAMKANLSQAKQMWDNLEKEGIEGFVVYHQDQMIKVKPIMSFDMAIVAVSKSDKYPDRIGAVLTAFLDKESRFRLSGMIGGGFSDEERVQLMQWAQTNAVDEDDDYIWVDPFKDPLVVEIEAVEVNEKEKPVMKFEGHKWVQIENGMSGVLRFPKIKRTREDKTTRYEDIPVEQVGVESSHIVEADVTQLPNPGQVVYVGVFLDEPSKINLLNWWVKETNTPLLPEVKAEHVTIKFRPTPKDINSFQIPEIGSEFSMRVIGWAANDNIQAVAVEGDFASLPIAPPAVPHVTISHQPGVSPKESIGLLMGGDTPVSGPQLTGKIGFFNGSAVVGIPREAAEKTVIIMRGLPGSGKSTKAKSYGGTVVSADDFFVQEGEYRFDRSKIAAAHSATQAKFVEALERGDSPIVVDNTNTQRWEMNFYKNKARDYGYDVVIDPVTPDLPLEELAKRNIHGVPLETLQRMQKRWENE
jgi:NEDD4-binding protein 2